MIYKPAEESFRKGLDSLKNHRGKEAMAFFEASLLLDSRARKTSGQPRYRSYYGLCLASTTGKMRGSGTPEDDIKWGWGGGSQRWVS